MVSTITRMLLLRFQKASSGFGCRLMRSTHNFDWRQSIQNKATLPPSFPTSSTSSSSSSFSAFPLYASAFIFTLKSNIASAEDDPAVASSIPESNNLQRVEDGSIISNEHTIKWRIYTDNARSSFHGRNLDEAEKFFILALQEAKDGFGDRDAHVASSLNNLAELYRVRREFQKAEPLYLNAIEILEESFGPEDVRTGAAFHNLGQFYVAQRKLEEACNCYERALKTKGRILGHGHPDYADTMYHLGMVFHLLGRKEDSKSLVEDSIKILEDAGLGESATCIKRMKYLSQIQFSLDKLHEAENMQRKILRVFERSKVAACMLHLAKNYILCSKQMNINTCDAGTELGKAKVLLDDALRIARLSVTSMKERKTRVIVRGSSPLNSQEWRVAVITLLRSLDIKGLLEATKLDLQQNENDFAIDSANALQECLSISKEYPTRKLLDHPDVKAEYLSCLENLLGIVEERAGGGQRQYPIRDLQDLKDEVRCIKAELTSGKHVRS